jgi:hypothetical protein
VRDHPGPRRRGLPPPEISRLEILSLKPYWRRSGVSSRKLVLWPPKFDCRP